ncbi:oligosaccharide repeat unit polymerase [Ilyomonas limi]|uniref:Oligosaccharide repeat unit polymerase n=1 Tax=Ilyomonas limi TaxID=2575867 RepID=A0A4U3KZD9_9BACT|nr:O-antigen polymerase [Ilyomonas limi]TKK68028.1 oligosaccharide repeat unit polymerase [Ilyomonas limi]
MKYRTIFSPFMAYCFAFLLVIPIYLLDWSYLFPKLTFTLLFFFLITFCIAILGALFFKDLLSLEYKKQKVEVKDIYAILLVLFYLLEFAYSRSVPLLALLRNITFQDIAATFGIPVFHVFLVGFTVFLSIFFFHSYLSQKRKKYLLYYILTLVLTLLVISRITLTFIFIGSVLVYLMSIQKNFAGKILKIAVIAMLFFLAFGFIGNLRTGNEVDAGEVILNVSEAKPSFRQSGIPDSYFWAYMYIASPLANLQLNINRREVAFTKNNLQQLVIHEFFWDAVSKRIDEKYNFNRTDITQINLAFNVGTVFSHAYAYLGLWGMYIMFFFIMLLTAVFLFTLNTASKYYITYLACLNTLIILSIFDNVFTFTPLSIILIFPLLEKLKHFFIKSTPADE